MADANEKEEQMMRTGRGWALFVAAAMAAALVVAPCAFADELGSGLTAGESTVTTQAAIAPQSSRVKIYPTTLWAKCEYNMPVNLTYFPTNAKVTKITSSNPKVVKAVRTGSGAYDNYLMPLKAGKSKITVKYKVGLKAKTVSAMYKVKNYPKSYSSILVNGKKINISSNKYYYDVFGYKKTKATVKVNNAKGWTVVRGYAFVGDTMRNVKNGKSFAIPKGKDAGVFFESSNNKGETIQYGVRFYRSR